MRLIYSVYAFKHLVLIILLFLSSSPFCPRQDCKEALELEDGKLQVIY